MLLIPAIDLMNGHVVRLYKGDMSNPKIYSSDPVRIIKEFLDSGVSRVHIVDLDGARDGALVNFKTISELAKINGISLQVGGGLRNCDKVSMYFDLGISYAILGTVAIKDSAETKKIINNFPNRIILGLDTKNGKVATEGWYTSVGRDITEVIADYSQCSVNSIIHTNIDKDGTLEGVDLEGLKAISLKSPFPIIASGGVASFKDLEDLCSLNDSNIFGCIVGKALYEGKLDLKKSIQLLSSL